MAWPTAEVDVNRKVAALDRHRERPHPAQGSENELVVTQNIGVHGGRSVGSSVVEQGCDQSGSDASALPDVLY
jgi:hypothetical protein